MFEKLYVYIAIVVSLCACSKESFHETQECVLQADSMRAEGRMYSDSVRLAKSYKTLKLWRMIHPEEYVRCCYHYGRLLRAQDDPVSAMQIFIGATHTRTREYNILGRVYSNMGSICHLASEFPLSYDMYERSAEMFLKQGDTTAYYYALNDMAYELAEQGKKAETLYLLTEIEKQCEDANMRFKVYETKSECYLKCRQYDSAIFVAYKLFTLENQNPTPALVIAQAYSYLGQRDSATRYANLVLANSDELYNVNNSLYILTQDDDTKNTTEIRKASADRSDTQKLIEIRRSKLSQAVQLLEQDLARKPNLQWLYAICITVLIFGIGTWSYIQRKRRQHKLLSQQVIQLEESNHAARLQQEQIVQEHSEYKNSLMSQIEQNCDVLYKSSHIQQDLCWSDYNELCKIINQQLFFFAQKLQNTHLLNEKEIRLCILILIGISNSKQLADMLFYSESGIRNFKNRTAKKLNTNSVELRNVLINIALGEPLKIIK